MDQEIAVLQLQQKLDELDGQRKRLGGTRRGLLWLTAFGLLGPLASYVAGGRRRAMLLAQIGEIGFMFVSVALVAVAAWLIRDYLQRRKLDREMASHHQALRLLGLTYCGRIGYNSPPSYFIWRGCAERWIPSRTAVGSVVRKGSAAPQGTSTNIQSTPSAPDEAGVSLPTDRQDLGRHLLELSAESTRGLESLGGWRALVRRSLALTLPFGIYWMFQDPQYYTITRLFGELLFGLLPMAWIASVIWLIVDEKKARALRQQHGLIQGRLTELGLVSALARVPASESTTSS